MTANEQLAQIPAATLNEVSRQHNARRVFGRVNRDGNVAVFWLNGEAVTSLGIATGLPGWRDQATTYPVGSALSCLYDHRSGVVLSQSDAAKLGVEIEAD